MIYLYQKFLAGSWRMAWGSSKAGPATTKLQYCLKLLGYRTAPTVFPHVASFSGISTGFEWCYLQPVNVRAGLSGR